VQPAGVRYMLEVSQIFVFAGGQVLVIDVKKHRIRSDQKEHCFQARYFVYSRKRFKYNNGSLTRLLTAASDSRQADRWKSETSIRFRWKAAVVLQFAVFKI
jgi:hypothetical protein